MRAENDANLAAVAERRRGAARDTDTVMYLLLDEGVGAGLVLGGRLLRGADGTAGEIGHIGLDPRGQVCRCGNRGCLETFVGTSYLVAMVPHGSDLARDGRADLPRLVAAAHEGDPSSRRIVSEAGTALGQGVAIVANLFNPDRVVVGGPLAAAGELLLDPMLRAMELGTLGSALERVDVVTSELGEFAALYGALLVAAEVPV